jgi:hypothetical protein
MRLWNAYTLLFTHGPTLAGVRDAATAEQAERLARGLNARLAADPI